MTNQRTRLLLIAALFIPLSTPVTASSDFLLCGPDEDGCYEEIAQWCACIPYNVEHGESAYCFDFDQRTCKPLHEMPDCEGLFIYPNQATCLATLFHSTPTSPCMPVSRDYCQSHKTPVCAPDGHPETCHPPSALITQ